MELGTLITRGEFKVDRYKRDYLFYLLEALVVFQVIQCLAKAWLSADSIWEVKRNKGVFRDYLTREKKYGAKNLSNPTSL